jgi:hypothetical protein
LLLLADGVVVSLLLAAEDFAVSSPLPAAPGSGITQSLLNVHVAAHCART